MLTSVLAQARFPYLKIRSTQFAEVVKLVDTQVSGTCGGNPVEVRVLSSADYFRNISSHSSYLFLMQIFVPKFSIPNLQTELHYEQVKRKRLIPITK